MSTELLERLRTRVEELFDEEGERAGSDFKQEPGARRLANLVNKGRVFEEVIVTPDVLEAMSHVLGPKFKLSSVNVRSADPHNASDQPLHADSAAVADEEGYWVCNSIWMLDDFTKENGATRCVPGSHRWGRAPAPGFFEEHPGQILVTGKNWGRGRHEFAHVARRDGEFDGPAAQGDACVLHEIYRDGESWAWIVPRMTRGVRAGAGSAGS